MKTVGVLGGMSSVASAEYYRRLNEGVNAHLGGHASAELLLYSVDFAVIEACIRAERWDQAADYLAERARRLERGGAEFLVLATNTLTGSPPRSRRQSASPSCTLWTSPPTPPSKRAQIGSGCWGPHQ